jgi:hypothetical protein
MKGLKRIDDCLPYNIALAGANSSPHFSIRVTLVPEKCHQRAAELIVSPVTL